MIDRIVKEEIVRARLSRLGFDLEREPGGFDWIVRDRRVSTAMPALQPTRAGDLDTILELFQIEL
jgi:hypothetical protein